MSIVLHKNSAIVLTFVCRFNHQYKLIQFLYFVEIYICSKKIVTLTTGVGRRRETEIFLSRHKSYIWVYKFTFVLCHQALPPLSLFTYCRVREHMIRNNHWGNLLNECAQCDQTARLFPIFGTFLTMKI